MAFFLQCRISSTAAVNSDTDPTAGSMATGSSGFLQSCCAAGVKRGKINKIRETHLTGIFHPHCYHFSIVTASVRMRVLSESFMSLAFLSGSSVYVQLFLFNCIEKDLHLKKCNIIKKVNIFCHSFQKVKPIYYIDSLH